MILSNKYQNKALEDRHCSQMHKPHDTKNTGGQCIRQRGLAQPIRHKCKHKDISETSRTEERCVISRGHNMETTQLETCV